MLCWDWTERTPEERECLSLFLQADLGTWMNHLANPTAHYDPENKRLAASIRDPVLLAKVFAAMQVSS